MVSRRNFMKSGTAFLAAPVIVPRHVLGGTGYTPPSGRLTVAGVGVGGVGHPHMCGIAATGFQIEALCDVDDVHAKVMYDKFPQARRYRDYREMLAAEKDKIDCVYCATPDHTHAFVTLAALAAKKHVCCVKPLTRSLEEIYVVADAAKKAGTATQVTSLPWSNEPGCRTREIIESGLLGDVVEVHLWSCRPVWPQGMPEYPRFTDPVPASLDWNQWLGPSEKRPFARRWPEDSIIPKLTTHGWGRDAVFHPFNFRGWYEFGAGSLGDMGCHYINTVYKALKLTHPTLVTSHSTRWSPVAFPLACLVTYDYPAREGLPACRVHWYDGGIKPPVPREMGTEPLAEEGVLYVGTKGMLVYNPDNGRIRVLGDGLQAKADALPRVHRRRGDLWWEWKDGCLGKEEACCNFQWAIGITEFVLLGNLAVRTRKPIKFDPATMTCADNPEANDLIRLKYHNGYTLNSQG